MGSNVFEVQEIPVQSSRIKVHEVMCRQFLGLLETISAIFPDVVAARPRCTAGIKALCLLQNAMDKAGKLVRNCRESSKLYLALTGDTIVSRFEKTKNHFEQSLTELQTMVPVVLQLQIAEILVYLSTTKFQLDPHEYEAGKALRGLLEQDSSVIISVGNSAVEVLQFVAFRLHLTTPKDLLIERRSIRKLLNEVIDEDNSTTTKTKTLKYFAYILKKHEKLLVQRKQPGSLSNQQDMSSLFVKSLSPECTNLENTHPVNETEASMLDGPNPPAEFKCTLSSMLMYDPVVISSGQTFERTYIQKWFDDGHDTCPKTGLKLDDLSVRSNTTMRDLILRWSMQNVIQTSVYDGSLETSSNSICSNASSMRDIHLQIDISSLSIGSLDSSYSLGFSNSKVKKFGFYRSIGEIKRRVLFNVSDLPWESRCRAVQDVVDYLIEYNPSCTFISSENFMQPLVQFLKGAVDKQDVEAQNSGTQLLLTFLKSNRREGTYASEDVYSLLASFLEKDASAETLAIVEILSLETSALLNLAKSDTIALIVELLSSDEKGVKPAAIRILYNLSVHIDTYSFKFASNWIPKLVPFLRDNSTAGTCIRIFKNLSQFEEGRVSIVQTDSCISSMVELLDSGSANDQEVTVAILLSLCSQKDQYCHLVLHEGILPSLCHASVNGTEEGKASAGELLRLLDDFKSDNEVEIRGTPTRSNVDAIVDHRDQNSENKPSGKISGSFGRKMKMFFKKK